MLMLFIRSSAMNQLFGPSFNPQIMMSQAHVHNSRIKKVLQEVFDEERKKSKGLNNSYPDRGSVSPRSAGLGGTGSAGDDDGRGSVSPRSAGFGGEGSSDDGYASLEVDGDSQDSRRDLSKTIVELEACLAGRNLCEEEKLKLMKQLAEVQQKLDKVAKDTSSSEDEKSERISTLEAELKEALESQEMKQKEFDKQSAQLKSMKTALEKAKISLKKGHENYETLEKQKVSLDKNLTDYLVIVENLKAQLVESQASVKTAGTFEEANKDLEAKINGLQAKVARLTNQAAGATGAAKAEEATEAKKTIGAAGATGAAKAEETTVPKPSARGQRINPRTTPPAPQTSDEEPELNTELFEEALARNNSNQFSTGPTKKSLENTIKVFTDSSFNTALTGQYLKDLLDGKKTDKEVYINQNKQRVTVDLNQTYAFGRFKEIIAALKTKGRVLDDGQLLRAFRLMVAIYGVKIGEKVYKKPHNDIRNTYTLNSSFNLGQLFVWL
ncbi:unnamed protein product [Pylaiella littoralis]